MAEFLSSYGLWILLGVIFIAMHRFGMGCCGAGHQHGTSGQEDGKAERADTPSRTATAETKPGVAGVRGGSCH